MVSKQRRQLLAVMATTGGMALAGCSGGDSDDDDAGDGSDDGDSDGSGGDGSDGGSGYEIEEMCSMANENIEEIPVIGCTSEIEGEELVIELTVRNDGGEEINLFAYPLNVRGYTSTDTAPENRVSGGTQVTYNGRVSSVGAGETVDVTVAINPNDASPEDIEQYTVEVSCGTTSEGVYCEGEE